jgi:tetratricopeptide (TPR) repeat protein
LAIYERVFGTEHPDTASSYNNIGWVYYSLGEYDMAFEYFIKALTIDEKVFGIQHPMTKIIQENIEAVKSKRSHAST